MTTYLSTHFSIEEATDSQIAARASIANEPTPEILDNMKLAAYGMELVRQELDNKPILISSWLRTEPLEKIVAKDGYRAWCLKRGLLMGQASWGKYFATKAHPKGFAIDFTCPGYGTPAEVMKRLTESAIPYDQIIIEFGRWVHIDFSGDQRKALVIDSTGPREYKA